MRQCAGLKLRHLEATSGFEQPFQQQLVEQTANSLAITMSSKAVDVSPPRRFIFTDVDMEAFMKSNTKKELLRLVGAMGKSCSMLDAEYDPSSPLSGLPPAMASLHGSLRQMETWIQDFPPQTAQARFGNPVFRKWHARLVARSFSIVQSILDCHQTHSSTQQYSVQVLQDCSEKGFQAASVESQEPCDDKNILELTAYLHDAFGHPVRLDYGTGHESSFMVFLYCLLKLGCFGNPPSEPPSPQCLKSVTLSIWTQYLRVTRRLQTEYMLEPAGSHGVWGLDDYHCLPFYFGACQLIEKEEFKPKTIHDASILEAQSERYLYFGCIRYIRDLKRGAPFFESSPMLNDISHLPTWSKVSSGLLKMYEGEVLDKRQVVQHFKFGNIFKASWTPSEQEKEAPLETFRTMPDGPLPTTRAPWAK